MAATGSRAEELLALEDRHGAHNYHPLPVVLERGESGHGFERSRVGDVELHVTDLALGVPLSERMAQKCGREATRCALWLEGRYGEKPPFPNDHPQYEVLKVGEVVDETVALKGERAK